MNRKVMQVLLPDELAEEISASVTRGEYPSESDAVIGAIEEWRATRFVEDYSVDELRRLAQEGIDSGPGEFETFEEIKAEAHRRFKKL
jgi:antitoxin ParD1/3/4